MASTLLPPTPKREEKRVHTEERVGGLLIQRDIGQPERFLLVQERTAPHYLKWNLPISRIRGNENIINGAERTVREETGKNVRAINLLHVGSRSGRITNNYTSFVFEMKILPSEVECVANPHEIMGQEWFTEAEIRQLAETCKLQNSDLILSTLDNYLSRRTVSVSFLCIYPNKP